MKLYGFNTIPMIFLIGTDGTILERQLRGEIMTYKVDEALKACGKC